MDKFVTNTDIHGVHTRQGLDLHYPTCKLTKVENGVSFTGITILNNLPSNTCMRILINLNIPLKKFLQVDSFYSLDDYYEWKIRDDCASYR
jgi:hypothetical protein